MHHRLHHQAHLVVARALGARGGGEHALAQGRQVGEPPDQFRIVVQVGPYGRQGAAREDLDLPVPEAAGQEAWWRQAAREALEAAFGDPVGPVHVNCPFEEPLSPSLDVELPDEVPAAWLAMARGRAGMDFTPSLLGDTAFTVDEGMRARGDAEAWETIQAAKDLFLG